ncbi:MAG TPA: tubulin-like doman-containing protein, partial [Symbiobacteriaceae bacterium]|nr:tubulin-like doman-containing protein [Symbiobacteriaceae bacterium]
MSELISPRIYVGAGGSGRRMVALLKQAVESDPMLTPDQKRAFQFLAVDADAYQNDCKPLDPHSEYVHIAGFRPAPARQADYLKEAVHDWWYDSYTPPYVQQGAGAVRLIGRLCYFYHFPRIKDAFQQAVQRATVYGAGRQVAGEMTVYIIGSLAGGTGSSMMLDLAHMARRSGNYRQVYVNSVILLPDVFTVTHVLSQQKFKDRWMANGYAALKELVYFNEHPREFKPLYRAANGREEPVEHPRMFDQCFFIEPVLGSTSTVENDDNMFRLAAQSVYLFSASAHGSGAGSVLVNTDGIHYASLGMQSIVYPREHVVAFARHWGTARLLEQILPEQSDMAQERAVREQVSGDLQAAGMAQLEALGAQALAQLTLPEPLEVDPEADIKAEAGRLADRYQGEMQTIAERLQA